MSSDKEEEFDLKFNYFSSGESSRSSSDEEELSEENNLVTGATERANRSPLAELDRPYLSRSAPIALNNDDSEEHQELNGASVSFMPTKPLFEFSPAKGKTQQKKPVIPIPQVSEKAPTQKK